MSTHLQQKNTKKQTRACRRSVSVKILIPFYQPLCPFKCLRVSHRAKFFQHLWQFRIHVLIIKLAGTHLLMSAAVIL